MERMKAEHCTLLGCDAEFETSNYSIATTSKKEWEYVVEGVACPPAQCGHGRRILSLSELGSLPETTAAGLRECEVVALTLYTGPMVTFDRLLFLNTHHHSIIAPPQFLVYNAMLRKFPQQVCERHNKFSTTILVLVSAVQKLCRTMFVDERVPLYRGLGGFKESDLPDHFLQPDAQGCRGFTEFGFMSTTANRKVAVEEYSGVRRGGRGLVVEMRVSSVDRGASIAAFSQYAIASRQAL